MNKYLICQEDFFSIDDAIGKECSCAGCWPNRTHNCPGCEACDGPVSECDGPDPDEDY